MKKFLQKKVIKKIFAAFVCASMVLSSSTGIFLGNGLKAEAAEAEPNWYGGAYESGVNIYAMSNLYGQCTWYAWGRAYELTGIKLPCRNDAKTWYSVAANNGYSVGAEPAENAIAVWSKGAYGHVAYVEAVNGNNVTISESNWTNTTFDNQYSLSAGMKYYSGRTTLTKEQMRARYGTLLGYIYLTGSGSASAPISASGTWKITATDGVNVRSGAGTGYSKVGFYAYNTVVTISEKATANGYTWGHTSDGWFVLDYAEPVSSDTEAPYVNVWISSLTNKGFTVSGDISDNVGVTDIKIAVWTEANGQDDLYWYSCMDSLSGNSFTAWFDLGGYGYTEDTYNIHIYVYDAAGNESGYPLTAYLDRTAPKGGNIKVSNISKDRYTVTCTASDNVELDKVSFTTWIDKNGKADLLTKENGSISGNTVTYQVKTSAHNNETGTYVTDVYAYDKAGNESHLGKISQEIAEVSQPVSSDTNIPDQNPGTKEPSDTDTSNQNPAITDTSEIDDSAITFFEKQIMLDIDEEDDLEYEICETEEEDADSLTWTSSDTSVAIVEDGHVTAVKAGTAVITVMMETGESAECVVTVSAPNEITAITMKKPNMTVYVGDTAWLNYVLRPEEADEELLMFSSSNKKVATVEDGIVKGVSAGKAVITVGYADLKATCEVTVKAPSIKLKKTSATVKAGKTVKIQATVTPKGKIIYSSSNKKVAVVSSKGVVKTKRKGKTVISVKANGITKRFKINVK